MNNTLDGIEVVDGDAVAAKHVRAALTAASFVYDDGSTQVFEPHGITTYVERGREARGEWYIDHRGRFCSYWPPSDRACYVLQWIVVGAVIVGVRFIGSDDGARFDGRYQHRP